MSTRETRLWGFALFGFLAKTDFLLVSTRCSPPHLLLNRRVVLLAEGRTHTSPGRGSGNPAHKSLNSDIVASIDHMQEKQEI